MKPDDRGFERRRSRSALVLLLAVLAPTTPAVAIDGARQPSGAAPAESSVGHDDGRRTLRRLPANLGRGIVGVFHLDNLVPLIAGGTAAAGASLLDAEAREAIEGDGWGEPFETGGGGLWSSVFVASMFTAGRLAHGSRFRAMSYDLLDTAIVNWGYTALLKEAVGRERPNGEDNRSFPSGHASNAFALATVAERHYGWKIGVPAYLLAGVVGASRVEQNKHYLSDVFAGATLGYIVGRTVVRVNGRPLEAKSSRRPELNLAPIVARDARGLRISVAF